MKLCNPLSRGWLLGATLTGLVAPSAQAATIPTLFNTGVDAQGSALGNNAVDPHYKLTTSPDAQYPGPDAVTVNNEGQWLPLALGCKTPPSPAGSHPARSKESGTHLETTPLKPPSTLPDSIPR